MAGFLGNSIDKRKDILLQEPLPKQARGVGAKHIEQPDQRERMAGNLRRQAMVAQIAGHVNADENHLESADEVAGHQQLEAGVAHGFLQRLPDGLLARRAGARPQRGFAQKHR